MESASVIINTTITAANQNVYHVIHRAQHVMAQHQVIVCHAMEWIACHALSYANPVMEQIP
jgi:hypothetical protein